MATIWQHFLLFIKKEIRRVLLAVNVMAQGIPLCSEVMFFRCIHFHPHTIKIICRESPKKTPVSAETTILCSTLCSFPLSIISCYPINNIKLVIFRTTLRRQLIPAEDEIGEVVAAAGIAAVAGHTLVPHNGLQETQNLQCQTHGGLSHVQTKSGNPPERGERTAFATGTAVEIQQRDEGSGGQVIGKNVPTDQSIAPFPAEPEVAVGGVDKPVLFLAKMVAVTLEEVSLSAKLLHSLLGCGAAALAEPGQNCKGYGHISSLPASQKEQNKGHPLGGVGQRSVGNQVVGYCGNRMQVGHLYGLLSSEFVRIRKSPGQRIV